MVLSKKRIRVFSSMQLQASEVHSKGILALAMRFYTEQLLEDDGRGNLPLHIALSTVNRDEKEYDGRVFQVDEDGEYEVLHERRAQALL